MTFDKRIAARMRFLETPLIEISSTQIPFAHSYGQAHSILGPRTTSRGISKRNRL